MATGWKTQGCGKQQLLSPELKKWKPLASPHLDCESVSNATLTLIWAAHERIPLSLTAARKTPRAALLPAAHTLVPASDHNSARLYTIRTPYPVFPKSSLLPRSAWAAVVQSHSMSRFDLTSALRWLRQARPGKSAMWLKNGNRRQEYKRRHTGCGSGSLAESGW